jgi:hypothetical protein
VPEGHVLSPAFPLFSKKCFVEIPKTREIKLAVCYMLKLAVCYMLNLAVCYILKLSVCYILKLSLCYMLKFAVCYMLKHDKCDKQIRTGKGKGKGKVHPRTVLEGPEGE